MSRRPKPQLVHEVTVQSSMSSPTLRRMKLVETHKIRPRNIPACPKGRGQAKVPKRRDPPLQNNLLEKRKLPIEDEEPFSSIPDCLRQYVNPQP